MPIQKQRKIEIIILMRLPLIYWDYVFRTTNNIVFYENCDSFSAKGMSVDKTHNTLFFNDVGFRKQ
jgi:hypothetical protein